MKNCLLIIAAVILSLSLVFLCYLIVKDIPKIYQNYKSDAPYRARKEKEIKAEYEKNKMVIWGKKMPFSKNDAQLGGFLIGFPLFIILLVKLDPQGNSSAPWDRF